MKTNVSHPPMILPWLARKAGISDRRAELLWHSAQRFAALNKGETDTPAYWKMTMDRLLELIAAESLREDAASFGWRPWSRIQARAFTAPLSVFDACALSLARGWRVFGHSIRPC